MLNLIGVIIAFIIVIILIRKKFNFGLSLIIGSIIVGVFSLQEIQLIDIPKAMIESSFYSFEKNQIYTSTIELAVLMTLIYILAKLMQETGAIKKIIESLSSVFSKGGILGIIPALYGLMPVPGGALFSAPMIDEEGEKYKLNKNQKNFLNVWFRHIWFPVYPISSAMITLILLTNTYSTEQNLGITIHISFLMLVNIPAFIAMIIIGFFYLRKYIKKPQNEVKKTKKDPAGLIYILPPVLPLFFYTLLINFDFTEYRAFLIGIIFSIILLYFLLKIGQSEYIKLIKKSLTINLALAIFGIMIFRQMITVSGSDILIADAIKSLNIPVILMIVLIPLILGLLTGYNLGAIGLSFPLVSVFFPSPMDTITLVGYISLIFISSLVGYLISPIHLCNVLSSDYLKTDTTRMYKMYVPSAIITLLVQILFVTLIINTL
jgi:integral membrane protein (TIGR00529 family)